MKKLMAVVAMAVALVMAGWQVASGTVMGMAKVDDTMYFGGFGDEGIDASVSGFGFDIPTWHVTASGNGAMSFDIELKNTYAQDFTVIMWDTEDISAGWATLQVDKISLADNGDGAVGLSQNGQPMFSVFDYSSNGWQNRLGIDWSAINGQSAEYGPLVVSAISPATAISRLEISFGATSQGDVRFQGVLKRGVPETPSTLWLLLPVIGIIMLPRIRHLHVR